MTSGVGHWLAVLIILAHVFATAARADNAVQESDQVMAHRAAMQRLHAAVRTGDVDLARTAIAAGVDLDRSFALELAILTNQEHMLDFLIEQGIDVNRAGPSGELPIGIAARRGHLVMLRKLVDQGADIRSRDRRGMSALDHALDRGHGAAAEFLRSRETGKQPSRSIDQYP